MDVPVLPDSQLSEHVASHTVARAFAQEFIAANDQYRALIAKQLYDSTAQSLGALVLQLSVMLRNAGLSQDEVQEQLQESYETAVQALEEVRQLSHLVYPRVLDELGLEVALERLARDTNRTLGSLVQVTVEVDNPVRLPRHLEIGLWGVAQAAVHTAIQHDVRTHLIFRLQVNDYVVNLAILDDVGIFNHAMLQKRTGSAWCLAQERLMLAEGTIRIQTDANGHPSLFASVPR